MLAGHSSNTDRYLKSNLKFQKGSSNPVPPLSKNQVGGRQSIGNGMLIPSIRASNRTSKHVSFFSDGSFDTIERVARSDSDDSSKDPFHAVARRQSGVGRRDIAPVRSDPMLGTQSVFSSSDEESTGLNDHLGIPQNPILARDVRNSFFSFDEEMLTTDDNESESYKPRLETLAVSKPPGITLGTPPPPPIQVTRSKGAKFPGEMPLSETSLVSSPLVRTGTLKKGKFVIPRIPTDLEGEQGIFSHGMKSTLREPPKPSELATRTSPEIAHGSKKGLYIDTSINGMSSHLPAVNLEHGYDTSKGASTLDDDDDSFDPEEARKSQILKFDNLQAERNKKKNDFIKSSLTSVNEIKSDDDDDSLDPEEARNSQILKFDNLQAERNKHKNESSSPLSLASPSSVKFPTAPLPVVVSEPKQNLVETKEVKPMEGKQAPELQNSILSSKEVSGSQSQESDLHVTSIPVHLPRPTSPESGKKPLSPEVLSLLVDPVPESAFMGKPSRDSTSSNQSDKTPDEDSDGDYDPEEVPRLCMETLHRLSGTEITELDAIYDEDDDFLKESLNKGSTDNTKLKDRKRSSEMPLVKHLPVINENTVENDQTLEVVIPTVEASVVRIGSEECEMEMAQPGPSLTSPNTIPLSTVTTELPSVTPPVISVIPVIPEHTPSIVQPVSSSSQNPVSVPQTVQRDIPVPSSEVRVVEEQQPSQNAGNYQFTSAADNVTPSSETSIIHKSMETVNMRTVNSFDNTHFDGNEQFAESSNDILGQLEEENEEEEEDAEDYSRGCWFFGCRS